jgi:hypothetical protein
MPERVFPGEEPAADARAAASTIRQMFVALVHEGFTEHQALIVVGQTLVASMQNPKGS